MVSYLRKVALGTVGVSVLACAWYGYQVVRQVWIDKPAPATAPVVEVPAEATPPATPPKTKRFALGKGADRKGQGND